MAEICPAGRSACALIDGSEALLDWHAKASVRRSPRHILNEEDVARHLFPEHLAPVLRHPMVRRLDGEQIIGLLNNHLFRYLDFTAKLEMAVVNDVVKDIAFGHMPVPLDDRMALAAHKIYVDEAYHALFSVDLLQQARTLLEVEPILPAVPRFLREFRRHLAAAESEDRRRLIRLFFVIVSETLITSSLTDIRKDGSLPGAIRKTVATHAMDEAYHHDFFLGLLRMVWPLLSAADRDYCMRLVPQFVHAFVSPDVEAIMAELQAFGLSLADARLVIAETYVPETVGRYARVCATDLTRQIEELAGFRADAGWTYFRDTGRLAT